jgi:hypothetical protein
LLVDSISHPILGYLADGGLATDRTSEPHLWFGFLCFYSILPHLDEVAQELQAATAGTSEFLFAQRDRS